MLCYHGSERSLQDGHFFSISSIIKCDLNKSLYFYAVFLFCCPSSEQVICAHLIKIKENIQIFGMNMTFISPIEVKNVLLYTLLKIFKGTPDDFP